LVGFFGGGGLISKCGLWLTATNSAFPPSDQELHVLEVVLSGELLDTCEDATQQGLLRLTKKLQSAIGRAPIGYG
jgi:hypothetical protein